MLRDAAVRELIRDEFATANRIIRTALLLTMKGASERIAHWPRDPPDGSSAEDDGGGVDGAEYDEAGTESWGRFLQRVMHRGDLGEVQAAWSAIRDVLHEICAYSAVVRASAIRHTHDDMDLVRSENHMRVWGGVLADRMFLRGKPLGATVAEVRGALSVSACRRLAEALPAIWMQDVRAQLGGDNLRTAQYARWPDGWIAVLRQAAVAANATARERRAYVLVALIEHYGMRDPN